MKNRRLTLSPIGLGSAGILAIFLGASLLWAYWPTLAEMERRWAQDPRYSHGYLVPGFALYLLWCRRDQLRVDHLRPSWFGILLLAAGAVLRLVGAIYYLTWFDAISFLTSLAGLFWIAGGWPALRWALPSIAFLIFMVPLPYRLEVAMGYSLRRIATVVSTYALQVLGLPAFSSGNTILIRDFTIGIIDACNGLGTAYMFLACAVAAAFLVPRPVLDRILLIASAIPIALVVNVMRIVATGLLHELVGKRASDLVYHDLAGWLMMFVTLVILYFECRLLPHLFVESTDPEPITAEPRAEEARPAELPVAAVKARAAIPLLIAITIVLWSGVTQGRWSGRWKVSQEVELAVARLKRIPLAIGEWRGNPQHVEPRAMIAAGLDGLLIRRFQNMRTGRTIDVVLVCGRPGPVSVHTPDICYPAAGYEMTQAKMVTFSEQIGTPNVPVEFIRADFGRQGAFPPEHLRIYWSLGAAGAWRVPSSPRLAFASLPFLYKMYLFYQSAGDNDPVEEESFADFLRRLVPELEKALFPSDRVRP
jgi:exosortase